MNRLNEHLQPRPTPLYPPNKGYGISLTAFAILLVPTSGLFGRRGRGGEGGGVESMDGDGRV